MKKSILLIVFASSLIPGFINAQSVGGIKGGVNFSNMYIDEVNDENMRVGFHLGFFVRSFVSDIITIQPELNFTTKGSTVTYDYFLGEGETDYNFNYIEVPLLFGVELGDAFRIQAGPYAAFLIGGKVVNDADDNILDFEDDINKEDFNIAEFGLAAGAGFGGDGFELGLRYDYGLSEIGKTDDYNGLSYSLRNAQHSVWQVYAAINF